MMNMWCNFVAQGSLCHVLWVQAFNLWLQYMSLLRGGQHPRPQGRCAGHFHCRQPSFQCCCQWSPLPGLLAHRINRPCRPGLVHPPGLAPGHAVNPLRPSAVVVSCQLAHAGYDYKGCGTFSKSRRLNHAGFEFAGGRQARVA